MVNKYGIIFLRINISYSQKRAFYAGALLLSSFCISFMDAAEEASASHIVSQGGGKTLTGEVARNCITVLETPSESQKAKIEMLQALCRAGYALDIAGEELEDGEFTWEVPLSIAAARGYTEVARWLLEMVKVPVNTKDSSDDTPLHYAAANGHVTMVGLLCGYGADRSAINRNGGIPLVEYFDFYKEISASIQGHSLHFTGQHVTMLALLQERGRPNAE